MKSLGIILSFLIVLNILISGAAGQGETPSTEFLLFTKEGGPVQVSASGVGDLEFDSCLQSIFLITGFQQPVNDPELLAAARSTALKDTNVFVVNYDTSRYFGSVLTAGRDIANFLNNMEKSRGLILSEVTLIGISLGSHVAARASNLKRVGRIIGADPAGPIYDLLPNGYRLSQSDADLVLAVHSSDILGTRIDRVGHVNYIINGGSQQPECDNTDVPSFRCSHRVAIQFILASVEKCNFHFRQCSSYWAFQKGLCNSKPTIPFSIQLTIADVPRFGLLYYYDSARPDFPYCATTEETDPILNTRFC